MVRRIEFPLTVVANSTVIASSGQKIETQRVLSAVVVFALYVKKAGVALQPLPFFFI